MCQDVDGSKETPTPGWQIQLDDEDIVCNSNYHLLVLRSLADFKPTLLPNSFNNKLKIVTIDKWLCYFYPYHELKH